MVPKVAEKGTSFKGAGAYFLHDKKADSSERVAFTHTENLPVSNPERAIDCMAYTAMHQNEIKAASGAPLTGRKLAKPVYTYSLSWAPSEEPTQEEMIEAGRQTLASLGLQEHEVLMVAHNDEPHPHLHLIVNRVHPDSGLAAGLSKDHLVLSRWAEAYEKQQGQIRCEQRVINNEARRRGEFVKGSLGEDFYKWRREKVHQAAYVREAEVRNLSAYHAGQREALYDEKEDRIRAHRADIKEQFRPKWAALYRQQEQDRKELAAFQASPVSRLAYWMKNRDLDGRRSAIIGAMKALSGFHDHAKQLALRHEQERAALAGELHTQIITGIRSINERYARALARMKDVQRSERQDMAGEHSRQSQQLAGDIREGRDAAQYEQERRAIERLKKQRGEKEHKSRQDRNGGRER